MASGTDMGVLKRMARGLREGVTHADFAKTMDLLQFSDSQIGALRDENKKMEKRLAELKRTRPKNIHVGSGWVDADGKPQTVDSPQICFTLVFNPETEDEKVTVKDIAEVDEFYRTVDKREANLAIIAMLEEMKALHKNKSAKEGIEEAKRAFQSSAKAYREAFMEVTDEDETEQHGDDE
jgi:hypothetical protein